MLQFMQGRRRNLNPVVADIYTEKRYKDEPQYEHLSTKILNKIEVTNNVSDMHA